MAIREVKPEFRRRHAGVLMPTSGSGKGIESDVELNIPQIDGLRGLAILAVIYQHAFSHGVGQVLADHRIFPYLEDNGWMGVSLFFILSGFVLARPFIADPRRLCDLGNLLIFYKKRASRLLPLFAIGCFVGYLVNHTTFGSLLLALTTMSMFTASDFYPQVNQPFWSLMLEIWFSVMIPILIIAAWRFGYWRVLAVAMAVALTVRLVGTQLSFTTVLQNPVKDSVVGRIDDFMIGVVVARLYVGGQLREAPQWLFALGVMFVVLSALGWDLTLQGNLPAATRAFLNLATSTGFACVLMSCLCERSRAAVLLSWRPLRVAGAMCFSLYCWHYWVMQATDPNSLQVKAAATFLLVTVAVSLLSYKFIEFPRRTWRTLMRMEGQQRFPVIASVPRP
jgi:peptidoglycan/LPS O-acetylase OafA/YrhL